MNGVTDDFACQLCAAKALRELSEFRSFVRVTSDAKPWPSGGRLAVCGACGTMQKLPDATWLAEIDRIYAEYDIYHQSAGAEQPIFAPGSTVATPRSQKLVAHLLETLRLQERGRLLDFGCGTGVTLRNFSAALPSWALYGSELSDRSLPKLRDIPGFVRLFTCPPEQIPERFDLLTLIHSLEHVIQPVTQLSNLRGRVTEGGHLFVEVPDCGRTPYDLVIADHLTHFTIQTLRFAGEQAGYRTQYLSDSLLPKELSWTGSPDGNDRSGSAAPTPDPRAGLDLAEAHLAWLQAQIEAASRIAAQSPRFGIFGTSISGTWLYANVRDRVSFFLDEDPDRVGRTHMGLPIVSPVDTPADADIFVPLIPEVAAAVVRRLAHVGARFHAPPIARMGIGAAAHVA